LAADQGFAKAQRYVGSCYISGAGVEKDEGKAFEYYRQAAEQGDSYG
jgi:TPR repeat protein